MLSVVIVLSFAAFALVRLSRKLVPEAWLDRAPVGCDVCWASWMSLVAVGVGKAAGIVTASTAGWPIVWLAVSGGALLLTEVSGSLRPAVGPPLSSV